MSKNRNKETEPLVENRWLSSVLSRDRDNVKLEAEGHLPTAAIAQPKS